jgi:hypothetical protein
VKARGGSVLIVVAGISALFLVLSLGFLARMRSDAEESQRVQQEAQARLMLNAGLHYIQEASRLGWDDPATPEHEEAYGWVDTRDGLPGPRARDGRELAPLAGSIFPAPGSAARCPMFVMQRPPFAVRQTFAYNPAPQDPARSWAELVSYENPDPQPAVTTWSDFRDGVRTARANSASMAWFRVYRELDDPATPQDEHLATFIITCGAGGTLGFKDPDDVDRAGAWDSFNNDREYFHQLRVQERVLHYRVEWNPAVGGSSAVATAGDSYNQVPVNDPNTGWWSVRGFVGSFLYIQRLDATPSKW